MRRNELVKIYQSTRAKTVKIEPSGFAMCDKTLRKNNADMRQLVVRISVPLRLQRILTLVGNWDVPRLDGARGKIQVRRPLGATAFKRANARGIVPLSPLGTLLVGKREHR